MNHWGPQLAWTDERISLLKQLCAEGLSYSQIAGRIGGVSRNAVIGKAYRLGLVKQSTETHRQQPQAKRPKPHRLNFDFARQKGPPSSQRAKAAEASEHSLSLDASLHLIPDPAYADCLTLEQLKSGVCRFPIGEPTKFCGRPTCERGFGSYCKEHAARAYTGTRTPPSEITPGGIPGFRLDRNTQGAR